MRLKPKMSRYGGRISGHFDDIVMIRIFTNFTHEKNEILFSFTFDHVPKNPVSFNTLG